MVSGSYPAAFVGLNTGLGVHRDCGDGCLATWAVLALCLPEYGIIVVLESGTVSTHVRRRKSVSLQCPDPAFSWDIGSAITVLQLQTGESVFETLCSLVVLDPLLLRVEVVALGPASEAHVYNTRLT
jgi:hypothetical protein